MESKLVDNEVDIDDIYLDPNNPRLIEMGHKSIEEEFYNEDLVQESVIKYLQIPRFNINELIKSIEANGFIDIESIIVRPWSIDSNKYIIVEGNRRIAAIKLINRKLPANNKIKDLQSNLSKIKVKVFEGDVNDENDLAYIKVIQGIRHISGPKSWGLYQQARLIVELFDDHNIEFTLINEMLGIGSRQTPKLYRVFKLLLQMECDEEYGDRAKPDLFSLFQKSFENMTIRNWIGWTLECIDSSKDDEMKAMNENVNRDNLLIFYGLITSEDGEKEEISNPDQLKKFGKLLEDENKIMYLDRFLSGTINIESAYYEAYPPVAIPIMAVVENAIEAFRELNAITLEEFKEKEIEKIDELVRMIQRQMRLYQAFKTIPEE
jgi:ParB-like chromosome segregation protein Spo0J